MNPDARPLILHVIHHLKMGGLENGLVNLINNLPEDEFRHGILCIEDSSDFRARIRREDVPVFELHRSKVGVRAVRRQLKQLFRREQPAIVHSRNLSGLDALLPARLAGVRRCIHGEHGRDVDDLDGTNKKLIWLRRLHSPLVSRYICVSEDLSGYLVDKVRVRRSRIHQIYNGVDTRRFTPVADRPAARASWPAAFQDPNALVVGTVGRAVPVKDQATLLRAFARCRAAQPALTERLRLVMLGDGPLLPELKSLAEQLTLGDSVWLPGARDDVPALLGAFDVFVLPSLAEGISNTILEAMASGLPVLATGVGGNLELVANGDNGAFFTPGDDAALARLIAGYAEDPTRLAAHADASRQRALTQFSLDAMMNGYADVYREVLRKG